MKANELRIGNWVMGNAPFQVDAMQISLEESRQKCGYNSGWQPIPLTEEWLERLGFARSLGKWGNNFHIISENGITILFTVEHWTNVDPDSKFANHWHTSGLLNGNKLKYVHQLQNLYFALTGEEL